MPEVQVEQLEPVVREAAAYAGMDDEQKEANKKEEKTVARLWKEYDQARNFDSITRSGYVRDRRYAAGTANLNWAVTTNLIGSFIDILTSFLYARDPEVRVRKAKQVDNRGTKDMDAFATTLELVISRLWKKGRLKAAARKQVRSALTVGPGYFKAIFVLEDDENPEHQRDLNDLRDNIAKFQALQKQLSEVPEASTDQVDTWIEEMQAQETALLEKVEASIVKYLVIDFIPAQNWQCSLDVACTEDYLDANWNANHIFVLKDELCEKFPRLTEEEIKSATVYYQRRETDKTPINELSELSPQLGGGIAADQSEQFTKGSSASSGSGNSSATSTPDNGPEFAKIVELWDKRDNKVKTMVEGIKRWAKEPYVPRYGSTRFFPYFRLAFYEVDGERHPQSLSGRLYKLQDEYSASRSSWRQMRERAIPATIFNATNLTEQDVRKIEQSTHQEFIGIAPIDPTRPLKDNFTPKAYEHVDPRMFENGPIKEDMEKISGVQEALQSSVTAPKTATEANIQQSGFASRTTSDRDAVEDLLTDFAQYTAEISIQCLTTQDAQRIAGPAAFWPHGMSIDDIVTMVEVDIKAGTTGKPNREEDKQTWAQLMPTIQGAILAITQSIAAGDLASAKALSELIRMTMTIMGDDTDPELFIPQIPDDPEAVAGQIGAAPAPGPGSDLPPSEGEAGAGAEPSGELQNPTTENPELSPPVL